MNINQNIWHTCQICHKKIQELAKIYGGSGIYYTQVFIKHLKEDHGLNIKQYFEQVIDIPPCFCNYNCGKKAKISGFRTPNFYLSYACGRNEGVMQWSKQATISRLGPGNPMYGKKPWNKDLTKETSECIRKWSDKRIGIKCTPEQRKKMSDAAKKRTVHGHTGHKHSQATKDAQSKRNLKYIKEGRFKQTKTKPHMAMCDICDALSINYEEEKIMGHWSFDIYLIDFNIFIEVDGDYFHTNPKRYPNGPISKTQKINHSRDKKKNKFCTENNLYLKRFWEDDILNNKDWVIQEIQCMLKKLLELKK